MKKIILSLAMVATGLTYSCASDIDAVKDALINKSNYKLIGTFGSYDFEPLGDNDAFDWAFTLTNGTSYQLQGNEATISDVFGWKEVTIETPAPVWYMFSLDGDVDGDGSTKFDWVLLSADVDNRAVYKLKGETPSGNFDYLGPIDVDYIIENDSITTGAAGTLSNDSVAYSSSSSSTVSEQSSSSLNESSPIAPEQSSSSFSSSEASSQSSASSTEESSSSLSICTDTSGQRNATFKVVGDCPVANGVYGTTATVTKSDGCTYNISALGYSLTAVLDNEGKGFGSMSVTETISEHTYNINVSGTVTASNIKGTISCQKVNE
jgi:hypothetical protein